LHGKELGALLRNILASKRWTVYHAAQRTGINPQTLNNWVHDTNLENVARFHSTLEKMGYEVRIRKLPRGSLRGVESD